MWIRCKLMSTQKKLRLKKVQTKLEKIPYCCYLLFIAFTSLLAWYIVHCRLAYVTYNMQQNLHQVLLKIAVSISETLSLLAVFLKVPSTNIFLIFSGVIGSGVCVFSKYPITDIFTYPYSLNGYMYMVHHGDWFGGKSVGYCLIDHPIQPIYLFTTHVRFCIVFVTHNLSLPGSSNTNDYSLWKGRNC